MSASEAQRELEIQTLITKQFAMQAKLRREVVIGQADAQKEYEANLALIQAQNEEVQKYDRSIRVARDNTTQMYDANSRASAESTSMMSKFTATLGVFNQESFSAAKRLYDLSAERRELTDEISATLGGSSRIFTLLGQNAKSSTELIDSANQNVTGKLKKYYEDFGGVAGATFKELNDGQMNFVAQVNSTDRAFLNSQAAMDEFYRASSGYKKDPATGQFVPDSFFMVQGVPLDIAMGSKKKAFEPFLDILNDENLNQPFARKMLNPEAMDESLKELKRINVAITGLGMQSKSVTDLVRTNFIRSGEATTDYFDEVVRAAETGQNAFGYSANIIVNDIYKMTQNIEMFGFRSGDEFAKIASRAKDLHMTIEDVQTAMGKFDTFESAAQTVGQLNAALGTNYDALELMTLKYEDPALMLEKLREGLTSTGKTFDEIPITYKRMITQQLGITMEGLRGMMDGNVRSLEEMTEQQNKAKSELEAGTPEQAQVALDARLEQRFKITNSMIEQAEDMAGMAERVAKVFAQDGLKVSEMAERTKDSMHVLAQTYTKNVAPAVTELARTISTADDVLVSGAMSFTSKAIESKLSKIAIDTSVTISKLVLDQVEEILKKIFKSSPELDSLISKARSSQVTGTTPVKTPPAEDLVMKGELDEGDRVILSNYGSILRSTLVDKKDTLIASPSVEKSNVNEKIEPTATRTTSPAIPAVSDAIRASLQGVGTSLRIELDVGQLTDLVLRDIMMNKPNVFGGVG